jgi:DNA polymerase
MATQVPFTGGSGRLLDRAFDLAGVTKKDVFLTNVVHCHPPDNRASLIDEINNCRAFLEEELRLVVPLLVIGFGRDAADWLRSHCGEQWDVCEGFDGFRTCTHRKTALLVSHPAYIMRRPSEERASYVAALGNAIRWAFSVRACLRGNLRKMKYAGAG